MAPVPRNTPTDRRWRRLALVASCSVLALASLCVVTAAGASSPAPASAIPSPIAKVVCAKEAQTEIGEALGVTAVVSTPTWSNHLYSCTYRYSTGALVLSVKGLSSWSQIYGYFDGLAKALHKNLPILDLGQGAFRVRGGSIVVRKDWKVLLVDIDGLPSSFGSPPSTREGVALTVAGVIMARWHGD